MKKLIFTKFLILACTVFLGFTSIAQGQNRENCFPFIDRWGLTRDQVAALGGEPVFQKGIPDPLYYSNKINISGLAGEVRYMLNDSGLLFMAYYTFFDFSKISREAAVDSLNQQLQCFFGRPGQFLTLTTPSGVQAAYHVWREKNTLAVLNSTNTLPGINIDLDDINTKESRRMIEVFEKMEEHMARRPQTKP